MPETTSYGTWNNHGDSTQASVEATIEQYINGGSSEWVERFPVEEAARDYREAINQALPDSVSLLGNDFYGPWPCCAPDFDDYPATDLGDLDISAVIERVDLDEIVNNHDPDVSDMDPEEKD